MSEKKEYKLSGMTCAACAMTVEMAVKDLETVEDVSVNLATERLSLLPKAGFDSQQVLDAVAEAGYHAEEKGKNRPSDVSEEAAMKAQELQKKKQQLLILLVTTLPLLYISMGSMVGLPLPSFLDHMVHPLVFVLSQLLLTLPAVWIGRGFYQRGFRNLIKRHPNMDSLIAVGTSAAFFYSLYSVSQVFLGHHPFVHQLYFESVAVIIALVLLGKYLESSAKGRTSQAIQSLLELVPSQATVIRYGEAVTIDTEDIRVGDIIRIKPGERMPVDGLVIEGQTFVDESMMTGESVPIEKKVGDTITSATINQNGSIDYQATRVGSDTTLAQIVRLVEEAQGSKAPIAALADKISLYFVPIVLGLATLSALGWYFLAGESLSFSLSIFVAVLVIACPCALGLATPTAIMVGTGKGAENGILIKSGQALEAAYQLDTIVLDKTGTITVGKPSLTDLVPLGAFNRSDLLQLIASAEQHSEHPLAQAILEAAEEEGLDLLPVSHFEAMVGRGLSAQVEGKQLLVGNESLMKEKNIDSSVFQEQLLELSQEGKTAMFVAVDGWLAGILAVADEMKSSSLSAVQKLQSMGLEVIMLTGDREETATAIAQKAGIQKVIAGVLPDGKATAIKNLQEAGKRLAMVGDGINDAPALVQAAVGIAIGSGADVAIESADVVLMHSDLQDVVKAIKLSQATIRNIKENLFWAFAYNTLGIPIAMGLLHLFGGPLLNPMLAGLAMSLSSVSVVANALRLGRFKMN
ncbi:P-ATPase superfamily P-type ATPase copper transporter [Streptococcus sanguinis SK1 = NCTC 7863]|uniref:P-type Cu(+) transporter n=2 Tax=Streptococcus sanguinis TaxID=1305 RepID=F2CFT1_STRSA|nr:heavy metal translocating P-type ATPase [Streptococcus sanguinis]EGC24252.1 copper-exporting ATPase [Streptococcus sanguinis SK405]EGC26328.1 copper-exporting ATPase [Streptococcus sanguinis SK678]EGF05985.1 P-ATPase superfamily P-type ATPase copper transporter [Streptococcus sanguinis SK1 = NCTC 7863]EGF18530.1 P-ATPase superfamily P-type ATPase copper transporter [Streptococcus sanguinis SK408]EGF22664.1 P-ATPase superfamily P-type ATPase copper transporter [Streptococcus sanguinis SK1058